MSIDAKLIELQRRRDVALVEMDDYATHFGRYIRAQYSPAGILRRHIGPAMGLAATLGTLVAGIAAPGDGLLQALMDKLLSPRHSRAKPTTVETSSAADAAAPLHHVPDDNRASVVSDPPSRNNQPILDVAEPIVKNLIVGVAQAIPWRRVMERAWEKWDKNSDTADDTKGSSGV
ncbi:MAG: hypothetical protein ACP5I8_10025 [Phycisphaerae bacterium]